MPLGRRRSLRPTFDDGDHYYAHDGQSIWVPPRTEDQPSDLYLEQHADEVFKA